jgi:hypothetical protein
MQDEGTQGAHQDLGDAGDATLFDVAAAATPIPPPANAHEPDTIDSGDAGVATVTALADDLEYTLTVGQALERIVTSGRKPPSLRSLQRYCEAQLLASKKIRTSFGSEWLINQTSLAKFIEAEPIVTGDASDTNGSDMAASASPTPQPLRIQEPDAIDNGVASDAMRQPMATPKEEARTIAEVLIENARLLAQVEGKDAIIIELKEDRTFLREEVREGRRTRDDVKNIAERMLDTLKTMATGRLSLPNPTPQEPVHTTFIDSDSQQG